MAERYRRNAAECRYRAWQAEDGPWKAWLLATAERYEAMTTQADESAPMVDSVVRIESKARPARDAKPQGRPRVNPRNYDCEDLKRLAWRHRGVLVVEVDSVKDELVCRILTELGAQLYVRRGDG